MTLFSQIALKRDGAIILDVASSFACVDTAEIVRECRCGKDHFRDAALRARRDPTRTLDLRRKFIRELQRRWRKISKLVTEAVATSDMFGLAMANARAFQIIGMSSGRVNAFQMWIDAALADTILGMDRELWIGEYIRGAYSRGWNVAQLQVGRDLPLNIDRADIVTKLTIAELQGVIEAFSQRAVRAFSDGLLSHLPPATIARAIRKEVDRVGIVRSRMTVQSMVVRANGEAALDFFESAGHTHVQVLPETVPSPGRMHAIRDAAKKRRRAKRRGAAELVEVLTAGDDDVCPICEDIAAASPYTIADARGLIPAHPHCRCAFVPAADARFAHGDRAYTFDSLDVEVSQQKVLIAKWIHSPAMDAVELTHGYRIVRGGELKVGQIFRDPNEAKLARDVQSLDAGEGSQVWEVDVSEVETAEADAAAVYLPPGTAFEVMGFDEARNVWNVEARA